MKSLLYLFFFLLPFLGSAQEGTDLQLAQHYYGNGEFEKALPYFEKIYKKDDSKFNFKRLYDCYIQVNDVKEAEKILKKQINKSNGELEYLILLAGLYEQNEDQKAANKVYADLIETYSKSSFSIGELYQQFKLQSKYDLALELLEKGRKFLKDSYPLHLYFADLYAIQGQKAKMIQEYMDLLDIQTSYASSVQNALQKSIDFTADEDENYDLLKNALLSKAQRKPNEPVYSDLLIWLFVQKKQFNAALIQAKSLDKREEGLGKRVFDLGVICLQNKAYEPARNAFKYVVDYGEKTPYFYDAEFALLNTQFVEITNQQNFTQESLREAIANYDKTINRIGKNRSSVQLIREKAEIQAYYLNEGENAINELTYALEIPGLTDMQQAQVKMLLADIHVLKGDVWEASLLYMQIDKSFKFETIGSEAKFKNARIFYYDGDFDFAQSQLDVLKQSTSKLIANDAINLSVLITDNYGLDSNYVAMSKFAQADLLLEQRQFAEAFALYDSIVIEFPYHSLGDEILMRKAKAMKQQGNFEQAISFLNELLKIYGEDILADDAWFELGVIYADHLNNSDKASECFKKILFDFKGSLYTNACRNRIRLMRGDKIELEEEL